MAKIRKFRASVDHYSAETYYLTALRESLTFTISTKAMHSKAVFPDEQCDRYGKLRVGTVISVVAKTSDNDNISYFPDTTVYEERTASSGVTREEYASSLLNLLDHSHEMDSTATREIVNAITTSSTDLVCRLIRKALFGVNG